MNKNPTKLKGKHSPIRRKLMRVIMLISGTVLILTCTAFFIYEYVSAYSIAKRQMRTLGEIVAANSTAALAFNSKDDAIEILNALKAEPNIVAACLYDKEGAVFAKYPTNYLSDSLPPKIVSKEYSVKNSYLQGFEQVIQGDAYPGTLFLKMDMKAMYSRFLCTGSFH